MVSFTRLSVKISRRIFSQLYLLNEKRLKHSSIPFSSSRTVVSLAELDFASSGASPEVSVSSSLFGLGMVRGKKKTKRDTTRAIVPNMRKPSHQAPIQRGSLGVIVVASNQRNSMHAGRNINLVATFDYTCISQTTVMFNIFLTSAKMALSN